MLDLIDMYLIISIKTHLNLVLTKKIYNHIKMKILNKEASSQRCSFRDVIDEKQYHSAREVTVVIFKQYSHTGLFPLNFKFFAF